MASLRPDPGLYDVEGWRALVEELRAAPAEDASPDALWNAEMHLAAISNIPPKTAPQAA